MKPTVADICSIPSLSRMRLVAGEEGLTNEVTDCGILDYEYDSSVSDKYFSINFTKGQFILSSFLYAKDNSFLVMDAIKKLIARGCSGLAIKNIFRIPFHDSFLRYADSMKFPIFILEDTNIYFERFIIETTDMIRQYGSLYYRAGKAEQLMNLPPGIDPQTPLQLSLEINPALRSDLIAVCFHYDSPFPPSDYLKRETDLQKRLLLGAENSLFYYKNGLLLIHSSEIFPSADPKALAADFIREITAEDTDVQVGISQIHHSLNELGNALRESIDTATLHKLIAPDAKYLAYHELGVYQLLLSSCEQPAAQALCQQFLQPLRDHDIENKTALFSTVEQFVLCGGSIDKAADVLHQHKNTIRYRIEKVSKLFGFSILQPEHYEKISIAVKLQLCVEARRRFTQYARTNEHEGPSS